MNILLEYVVVFVGVLILQFFMNRVNNKKNDSNKKKNKKKEDDNLLMELLYLKKLYKIDVNKIDKAKFSMVCTFTNTFIISTIYIILMYLLDNWILRIIIGIVLLILMIIISYGIIGRYYAKKEGE